MRTSIILDDELIERFREKARSKGQSLSAFLAEAGRAALRAEPPAAEHPFKLVTFGTTGTHPGINLDHTNALIAAEDEGLYRP